MNDLWTWVEYKVAGFFVFSHIRMMSYVRYGLKSVPQGYYPQEGLIMGEKVLGKYEVEKKLRILPMIPIYKLKLYFEVIPIFFIYKVKVA